MNNIKKLRKNCKLTQQQLADKSNINIRQIQRIESGDSNIENITLKNAILLAKALNRNVEDLI